MNVATIEMPVDEAREKWKEYRDACKDSPQNVFLRDMKKIYNALGQGRKIIDIDKAMLKGGLHSGTYDPRLAIARADFKYGYFKYENETIRFFGSNDDHVWDGGYRRVPNHNVVVGGFPALPDLERDKFTASRQRFAPLPMIPPSASPKASLHNYHILWEVDKWKAIEVPKDPWLLRRLTPKLFVVLAGWDLTELERAVIAGRMG